MRNMLNHSSKAMIKAVIILCSIIVIEWPRSSLAQDLDQGWTDQERDAWYTATQGSRLIPLDWLRALKEPGGDRQFLDPTHMASFGYLEGGKDNAELPTGFAFDTQPDESFQRTRLEWKPKQGNQETWVGLNCAACHTNQISFKGKPLLIDGASALADFKKFVAALNASLQETRTTQAKWAAFEKEVLKDFTLNVENKNRLEKAFDKLLAWQQREASVNKEVVKFGPSRVDAFGHIYNKVAMLLDDNATGNLPDAPVSIPHIWRAPQFDKVQYNGIAKKKEIARGLITYDVGALGRNTGEVIGVFGDVVPVVDPGITNGFVSSVEVANLSKMEDVLAKLRPPKWPSAYFEEDMGDEAVAARKLRIEQGKGLFATECARCHELLDRGNLTKRVTTQLSLFDGSGLHTETLEALPAPDTDLWMACNSYTYAAKSGVLNGVNHFVISEGKIGETHHLAGLLQSTVISTLLAKKWALTKDITSRILGFDRTPRPDKESVEKAAFRAVPPPGANRSPEKQARATDCVNISNPLLGYTSRPLNGIWASPPYLHNGSVPTMYELLLPPEQRVKSFHVGTREYDTKNMGFRIDKTDPGNDFEFKTHDGNLPIDGNSNAGHDYNNDALTPDERYAIIEYLKTL